jgi:molybdopterin/thiamine biosynthesis adenylyltransferase
MRNMAEPSTRYARQIRFQGLGEQGQAGLAAGTAVIVGVGALGSAAAQLLARAGIGTLRLIDRDLVEMSNLHRQVLFTEEDARLQLPKAIAAGRRLQEVNSAITIEPLVEDLVPGNVDRLLAGAGVVVDGTDNFETRYLLNEWSVREQVPWIYGAAVSAYGLMMPVLPGRTACLSCVFETAPPPEMSPTCESAGVIGPVTALVAALQAAEAMKILAGRLEAVSRTLTAVDVWDGRVQQIAVQRREENACPTCGTHRYPHLEQRAGNAAEYLCGRNAVQVRPRESKPVDLAALENRLRQVGRVVRNDYLVRVHLEGLDLTIFADGRSLVVGTEDTATARSLVSRYVGA